MANRLEGINWYEIFPKYEKQNEDILLLEIK